MADVIDRFSAATQAWFRGAFPAPTPAQVGAWESIASGSHTLVIAPTGSGKTLSAFLSAIDALLSAPVPTAPADDEAPPRTRVLYISPLKALGVDVERNLRAPLTGITAAARTLDLPVPEVTVGVRSGDTPPAERRRLVTNPPDILITTPESLFLMLTSNARETLASVETVIVDEIHAVAATKRGTHLALSLERLDALLPKPAQRIGLSATVRPPETVARFLGGAAPVRIVDPPAPKTFDLTVAVPVPDLAELPAVSAPDDDPSGVPATGSIWPHVEASIVDLIVSHRSSIVFANSRRLAEKLTARLNELYAERLGEPVDTVHPVPATLGSPTEVVHGAAPVLARAHHGSVSKEQRAVIEDDLKSGRLRCVVATSSLELGIDMGAVDLVVQVEAPPSVASGLQRIGRAGHQVGEVSQGVVFPKHRTDLLHCAVTVERMRDGAIESLAVPTNPLDILAQQTVAACALEPIDLDAWYATVRRAGPYETLPRSVFEATIDLLAGRYPSDEFAELRPRLVWDRAAGTITGRPGAQRLAVTSGGAIPDRGMFAVYLVGEKQSRVGELDEEMVYESRVGDVFALGATSWRIEEITFDRVLVSPAYGMPGRLPFWNGDGPGRPAELGAGMGAFVRELDAAAPPDALARARAAGLDEWAATNLVEFIAAQRNSTGRLPTDRTIVVERFRDELGDWRLVLHSPYGRRVHAPWALAVDARLRAERGIDTNSQASDDGIVVRLPDTDATPPGAELFAFEPDELEAVVTEQVAGSALFASRFRECSARALLLPRRNPGKRAPLWQQRQRSAQLLDVARNYPDFPMLLETVRECLQDVYDLPALRDIATRIARRSIRLVDVETAAPSPMASTMLFSYVGEFMYEGDSPLAERRAAALSLDTTLLSELLGRIELRELLDDEVIATTEAQLQRLDPEYRAHDLEGVADLLRVLGPLTRAAIAERTTESPTAWVDELLAARRAIEVTFAGEPRIAAVEDAARLRDGLGVPLPMGVPVAFLEPIKDPVGDLVSRYARTHGPFPVTDAARALGLGTAVVTEALQRLSSAGRVVEGEFRPGGSGSEWCDQTVLRRLRARSLAAARQEVEPVSTEALGRFLPAWQHVGEGLRGVDGLLTAIEQLAGVPVPASALESLILPARVADYSPAMLDELTTSGEVLWTGAGTLPGKDGRVALHLADTAPLTLAPPSPREDLTERHREVLDLLTAGGGYFFRQLSSTLSAPDGELADLVWDLTWAGYLGNDTLAPLRALLGDTSRQTTAHRISRRPPRTRSLRAGYRAATLPSRSGPPTVAGRWFALPERVDDPTMRANTTAELLLERHGVVTRGAVMAEEVPGGFALMYKVFRSFEDAGRSRRGHFVTGLGGAQFAAPYAVDRLREYADPIGDRPRPVTQAVVLAATDPANPYGAALGWPAKEGHRPGRKAGAVVVLVDGLLVAYLERGGRTMLTFTDDPEWLRLAFVALAEQVRLRRIDQLVIEKVDAEQVHASPLGPMLNEAGFNPTPKGFRLRG